MIIDCPKILYLYSAPLVAPDGSPLDVLDMKAERDALVRELTACGKSVFIRTGVATVDELARSIAEKFTILYVSSHGQEEFLLFEDGKGGSQPVTGGYLKRLLSAGEPFDLAVVSACHSEKIGALLVEAGIPHVVAITCSASVVDRAAIIFIGHFFRHLFRGRPVQKAFEMAKLLIEGTPELLKIKKHLEFVAYTKREQFLPEEEKFVLLPPGDTHAEPLLSQKVPGGTVTIEEAISSESLPVRPQSFTGRSVEMHTIINGLVQTRFVTVTGAGGIGKTTVAIEVARWFCSRNHFPDGVFYIDLRQVDTADGIIDLLGAAVKTEFPGLEDVITYIKGYHCLLVLDNAEDILWQDEGALQHIIHSILRFSPHVKLLVTSQRPVGGNLHEPERVLRIQSLARDHAAILFYSTTKRTMSQREVESGAFFQVLDQLGGHPLSIVLTARQLVPGVTLEDLCERIGLYKARAVQVKSIKRTLKQGESLVASLASAHHVLSGKAKTVFEILSMLPAGVERNMLTAIFGDTAWECVQELNDASLAEVRGHNRVTLLPPVRLFAMNVLSDKTSTYYGPQIVEVMGKYAKELYNHHTAKDAKEYRFQFSVDEPNLRSAVDLPCMPPQSPEKPSVLGGFGADLIYLYIFHNRWKEAEEVGHTILLNLKRLPDRAGEANIFVALGVLAFRTGDLEKAQTKYKEALRIYSDINEKKGKANAFWTLGDLAFRTGALEKAEIRFEEALKIYRDIDVALGEANALLRLGVLAFQTGDLEKAQTKYREALRIYRDIDAKIGEANTTRALGDLAMWTSNFEEAQKRYERALTIYQHTDVKDGEARTFIRLAQWAVLTGKRKDAEYHLDKALAVYTGIEDLEGQADVHLVKALIFLDQHDIVRAKRQLQCCSSVQDKICAHCEAAQWLILYAAHCGLHTVQEGAQLCLEYAAEFASKAQNKYLLDEVKQQLNVCGLSSSLRP